MATEHVRALVIGGGVVGVGTLYHLAKFHSQRAATQPNTKRSSGDIVLLERKELTSGSTWHAAGLLPLFNMSYSVGQIHKSSLNLYNSLEAETGLNPGLVTCGNIRLAQTQDRMDEYKYYAGVAETIGVDVEFMTPDEVQQIWPFMVTDGLVGAIRHPADGYIQPADLTQALAKGARDYGARILTSTAALDIVEEAHGWRVITETTEYVTQDLVLATGNFARRTASMVGLDLPVIPVQHQYIVTNPHPKISEYRQAGGAELGVLRDSDASYYMREERGGLLLGPYETGAPCCYIDGPDKDSEYELFQEDLERLEPHIEAAMERVPIFAEVGIKQTYNGAIAYTPDGSPLIGPAWGKRGLWINEGHSFGVTASGGAGRQLARWIIDGEPEIDMTGVDPRRYGDYASKGYLLQKNEETYANVFTVHFPTEERPAARPLRQVPAHDRWKALGAVFGQTYGWERPQWFARSGQAAKDVWSFRRSVDFESIGDECRNVANGVGIQDMSPFTKLLVEGPDAAKMLDHALANQIPAIDGQVKLCHLLTVDGGVRAEFTVQRQAEKRFYLVSAGAYERHDLDTLRRASIGLDVTVSNVTTQYGVLVLAGPRSRELLQRITTSDVSNKALRWLTGKQIDIGAAQANCLRLNFIGELGYELHHPIEMQNYIFDLIWRVGKDFDLKPFGIRAMNSLRLEKSYRMIPNELSIEYTALESALDRFISFQKSEFIGRDALLAQRENGQRYNFATLDIEINDEFDPRGSEPVYKDGRPIGRMTSAGYGYRTAKCLGMAMLAPEYASIGTECEIKVLGETRRARVIEESPYDPTHIKSRS